MSKEIKNTEISELLLKSLKASFIVTGWENFMDNGVSVKEKIIELEEVAKHGDLASMATNLVLWRYTVEDLITPSLDFVSNLRFKVFAHNCDLQYPDDFSKSREESKKYIPV